MPSRRPLRAVDVGRRQREPPSVSAHPAREAPLADPAPDGVPRQRAEDGIQRARRDDERQSQRPPRAEDPASGMTRSEGMGGKTFSAIMTSTTPR